MEIPEEKRGIPIRCYHNGKRAILPLEEAVKQFWASRFGWVLKLDYFRSGFGEDAKNGSVAKVVHSSGVKFAMALLNRGSLSVGLDDSCVLDEHEDPPSRNQFTVWAYRFGLLFAGDKPYECIKIPDEYGICQTAYRMKPSETWLVVMGVASEDDFSDVDVPWEVFQTSMKNQLAVPASRGGSSPAV